MYEVLLVIHTILVLFLIGLVLIQRSDSDGLSGLGGGGGGGGGNQFMTGRGSANLMTRTTAILAGIFMLTSLSLGIIANRMNKGSIVDVVEELPIASEDAKLKLEADTPKPDEVPASVTKEPMVPKPE